MQVTLSQIAYARSGDKGDGSNVGVVAYNAECYEIIKAALTPARVKEHFREIYFEKMTLCFENVRIKKIIML